MFVLPIFCKEATLTVPTNYVNVFVLRYEGLEACLKLTSLSNAYSIWSSRIGLVYLASIRFHQLLQFCF